MAYYTYILRCADGSLYTGITTDPARRFAEHAAGKAGGGAKYTFAHPPVAYECAFLSDSRSAASKLEAGIKGLTRAQKLRLIAGERDILPGLEAYERVDIALVKGCEGK